MIHASVAGAETPVAGELLRILLYHPDVEITSVYSPSLAGKAIDEVHHGMIGDTDLRFSSAIDSAKTNMVFVCAKQPDGLFAEVDDDTRIVDLTDTHIGADVDYVYGICELNRKPLVRGALHAAVPSPVAQAALLALLPLAKHLLINADVTIAATQPVSEQSVGEVEAVIKALQLSFNNKINVEHIEAPTASSRALIAKVSFDCAVDAPQVVDMCNEFYDDHNFTFIISREPQPDDVANTNKCIMHVSKDGERLTVTVAIDPQVKGAAGTAVHCMNLLFGLHERVGLMLKASL